MYLLSRQKYKEEAADVTNYLKGVHHSRKISHMQVNYSDTVTKLSKMQETVPVYLQKDAKPQERNFFPHMSDQRKMTISEYQKTMGEVIKVEKDINERKRLYNREVGRKAIVNEV